MKKEGSPVLPSVMILEEVAASLRLLSLTVPLPERSASARPDMTGPGSGIDPLGCPRAQPMKAHAGWSGRLCES